MTLLLLALLCGCGPFFELLFLARRWPTPTKLIRKAFVRDVVQPPPKVGIGAAIKILEQPLSVKLGEQAQSLLQPSPDPNPVGEWTEDGRQIVAWNDNNHNQKVDSGELVYNMPAKLGPSPGQLLAAKHVMAQQEAKLRFGQQQALFANQIQSPMYAGGSTMGITGAMSVQRWKV